LRLLVTVPGDPVWEPGMDPLAAPPPDPSKQPEPAAEQPVPETASVTS